MTHGTFSDAAIPAVHPTLKEVGVDERAQDSIACRGVERPETLRLFTREPEAGHFEELAANPAQQSFIEWTVLNLHGTS